MFNAPQQRHPAWLYVGVLLMAVSMFGSACSGSTNAATSTRLATPEVQSTVGPTATSEPVPSATPTSRILNLLQNVPGPADEGPLLLTVIDYAAAYDRVGFEPPTDCPGQPGDALDTDDRESWIAAYDSIGTLRTFFMTQMLSVPQELDEAFGLQWCDVEAAMQTNFGGDYLDVRIPAAEVHAAMSGDMWAGRLNMTECGNSVRYEWDDVLYGEGPTSRSPLTFGWQGRLFVSDTTISRYSRPPAARGFAELANHSLADQEHVRVVVEQLERDGAVAMFLFENTVTLAMFAQWERPLAYPPSVVLAPWQFAGIAPREFAGAGSEREITLVIAHADTESAARNVTQFEQVLSREGHVHTGQPWSEILRLHSITSSGNMVVAHLSGIEGFDPVQVFEQTKWGLLASE